MNFRSRISRILGSLDSLDSCESEGAAIGEAMIAGRIGTDDFGYPILPPDPTPGEQLLWADLTLMRCSFMDGDEDSPEVAAQDLLTRRANEIIDELSC